MAAVAALGARRPRMAEVVNFIADDDLCCSNDGIICFLFYLWSCFLALCLLVVCCIIFFTAKSNQATCRYGTPRYLFSEKGFAIASILGPESTRVHT